MGSFLSHLGLTEVPDEITELKHVTVLRKDRIKNSSLKLFLYGNTLTQLPSYLFSLKNLSVLSLRAYKGGVGGEVRKGGYEKTDNTLFYY